MADVGRITELWRAAADALERPREPQWGTPYRDALQAEVVRLRAECGRLREQLDAARQALELIVSAGDRFYANGDRTCIVPTAWLDRARAALGVGDE